MQNRMYEAIVLLGLGVALTGCGLSKSDAHEIIKQENYDKDSNVYCEFSEFSSTGSGAKQAFESSYGANYCVWALGRAGVVDAPSCEDSRGKVCERAPFKLKGETSISERTGRLLFPCGTKRLGEVLSVTSEGKKAKVRYKRTVTLDQDLLKKVEQCTLKTPTTGEEELTIQFSKDDDGKWTSL